MDEFIKTCKEVENIDRKLKKQLSKHAKKTSENRDETVQSTPEKHEVKNTENSKTESIADLDRADLDRTDLDRTETNYSESDKSESLDETENSYDESLFLSEEWSALNKLLESHLLITRSYLHLIRNSSR